VAGCHQGAFVEIWRDCVVPLAMSWASCQLSPPSRPAAPAPLECAPAAPRGPRPPSPSGLSPPRPPKAPRGPRPASPPPRSVSPLGLPQQFGTTAEGAATDGHGGIAAPFAAVAAAFAAATITSAMALDD
jgi:hypothetical protein